MNLFLIILVIYNLIVFLIYGFDKFYARSNSRRIPEKVLLFLALLAGSPGALLGMNFFRHKTKKLSFQFFIILILFLQGLIGYLIYYFL